MPWCTFWFAHLSYLLPFPGQAAFEASFACTTKSATLFAAKHQNALPVLYGLYTAFTDGFKQLRPILATHPLPWLMLRDAMGTFEWWSSSPTFFSLQLLKLPKPTAEHLSWGEHETADCHLSLYTTCEHRYKNIKSDTWLHAPRILLLVSKLKIHGIYVLQAKGPEIRYSAIRFQAAAKLAAQWLVFLGAFAGASGWRFAFPSSLRRLVRCPLAMPKLLTFLWNSAGFHYLWKPAGAPWAQDQPESTAAYCAMRLNPCKHPAVPVGSQVYQ